ncbi:hypothetical protein LTR36_007301 [Oleoguttula mirabilis]|uniref:F-box domain-containing protein n=1 Tax=Oleoguttula mirabilis TaxID=1507867 RepID=A0AAV9JAL9_9PEZI|nr:hypothetical protein LTR36_007301 [Oleoguttula mirabilis]
MASKRVAEDVSESSKRRKLDDNDEAAEFPTPSTASSSKLMSLPPELRIAIFEFCLCEVGPIEVTALLKEPALLQTDRQVRAETRPIWYQGNEFYSDVHDCDATLDSRFRVHVADQKLQGPVVRIGTLMSGKCWSNLVRWCKDLWNQNVPALAPAEDMNAEEAVIAAAHQIATQHRKRPWAECEEALRILRFVVCKLDNGWTA